MPDDPASLRPARVFFAVWPDPPARAALHRAALAAGRRCGGRVMRPQTLHLTLAFIGDADPGRLPELAAVAAAVRAPAFALRLDHLGYWAHNRIVWAGSRRPDAGLLALADDLAGGLRAAGWPSGRKPGRDFAPHVTLVRKAEAGAGDLPEMAPVAWECSNFVLLRSRLSAAGPLYETIGKWPLGPAHRKTT